MNLGPSSPVESADAPLHVMWPHTYDLDGSDGAALLAGAFTDLPWSTEADVSKQYNFWTAFYAGLAAPIALYTAPPTYSAFYVPTTAQVFSYIGGCLTEVIPAVVDDGQSTPHGTERPAG